MKRPEEQQWGIPFDITALEAALSLAADLGLPLSPVSYTHLIL